ncbi:MAG: protein kinase [Nannocystaceae bacterium]|nr:protein kinase [Nannocystaceae bacterium]
MSDELTAADPVVGAASGGHTLTAVEPPRERVASAGLQPGARVGRYHVLGLLGQGGMGEVYRGYDADLDRPVAIKLLRQHATQSNLVLLREAQALAKLSHPNVVAIHDFGATGGSGESLAEQVEDAQQVFLAMEYIDGVDLAAWLKRPRSLAEILTVFEAAARGLAAAHAAGIVHRDFKPANVLVARAAAGGGIGRVCVADFGLARALSEPSQELTPVPAGTLLQTQLTGTGFVVGTPPYLSPEVHVGKSADALADQYAYFVALFEALFGVRPFLGRDLPALLAAKRRGVPPLPSQGPRGEAVPPWLRRMLQRGLEAEPSARHGSMDEVVATLERARAPARPRRVFALAGVAIVLGAGATYLGARTPVAPDRCEHTDALADEAWGPARREALRSATAGQDRDTVETLVPRLEQALDDHVQQWRTSYRAHCESEPNVGVAAWQLLDPQTRCLRHRLFAVDALARALSQPTTSRRELERGLRMAVGLAPPAECAAEVAAAGLIEPPAERLAEVEDARAQLDDAIASMKLGRLDAATDQLAELAALEVARSFEPFALEVALWQANLAEHGGRYAEAERRYGDVVYRGQAIGHDQLAWLAMYGLVAVRADRLQRAPEAAELLRQAWAMVGRLHNPRFWVGFFEMRGIVAQAQSRLLDAEVDFRTARALALQHYGPTSLRVAEVDLNLGVALVRRREREAARPILQELLAIFERQLGRDEDDAVVGRSLLGGIAFHDGDLDTAEREWTAVLQSRVRLLGAEHPRVLLSYRNLAQVAFARGDLAHTGELLDHALAIGRAREPTGGPLTRGTLFLLAQLHQRRGDGATARARLQEAVDSLGDRVDDQGLMALRGLAVKARECGEFDQAQSLLDRAAAILRATQAGPIEEIAADLAALDGARGHHDAARQRLQTGIEALSEPATITADRVGLRARLQLALALLELGQARCDAAVTAAQSALAAIGRERSVTVSLRLLATWALAQGHGCRGDAPARARTLQDAARQLAVPAGQDAELAVLLAVAEDRWTDDAPAAARAAIAAALAATPEDDTATRRDGSPRRASLQQWLDAHPIEACPDRRLTPRSPPR